MKAPPLCDAVDPRVPAHVAGAQIIGEWAMREIEAHVRARSCPVDFGTRWLRYRMSRALRRR